MSDDTNPLKGRRIFLVEDSPVVAPFTAEILDELGCELIGPAPNLATARELVETEIFDAALMDVRIRGERSFGICDLLDAKGIPFIFTSGYADWQLPEKWQDRPRLQKPYTIEQIEQALVDLLS
jgi:CheY-like chemotaxis protein